MAGDFICLETHSKALFNLKTVLSQLNTQVSSQGDSQRRVLGKVLQNLLQFSRGGKLEVLRHLAARSAVFLEAEDTQLLLFSMDVEEKEKKKKLDKPFVQLRTCRCRVHPHR